MVEKLEKVFTRDFTLFDAQWWRESLIKNFKREFGVGYTDAPLYSSGLTLACFYLESDTVKVKKAIFEEKYREEPNYYFDNRQKYLEDSVESKRVLKELHNAPLSLKAVQVLRQRFFTIFPMIRLCNFMPYYWEKETRKALGEKADEVIAIALEDRKKTEGIAEQIDSLLRRMASDKLVQIGKPAMFSKFLTEKELINLASGELVNWEEVATRTAGYAFCGGKIYPGKDWKRVFKQCGYFYEEETPTGNQVKGTVAFQSGIIKGKVRVVYALEQLGEFRDGEILVTPMTVPDFISAMKKAAAIVTDEGGITCHAAIVSRELKIPCVIGTKFATKLFKNGDEVEVDTLSGTVKKLT